MNLGATWAALLNWISRLPPKPILFCAGIETLWILFTLTLFIQPVGVFPPAAVRARKAARFFAWVALSIAFAGAMVTGALTSLWWFQK